MLFIHYLLQMCQNKRIAFVCSFHYLAGCCKMEIRQLWFGPDPVSADMNDRVPLDFSVKTLLKHSLFLPADC